MSRHRRVYRPPTKLPKGAGAVRCTVCGATARASGTGAPIVLPCSCHLTEEGEDLALAG